METNESILNKGVVSLNDRKLMGKVKGVVVDCEQCGISHFVITSSTTGGALVLPFAKSISVGDTFMTIQDRADFLPTTDLMARAALDDNFDLVGLKVYSRVGDYLGDVAAFDIDTASGHVSKIQLKEGQEFTFDEYVFFSPEFVFVDDGGVTDADRREGAVEQESAAAPFDEPADAEVIVEPEPEVVAEPEPDPEPEAVAEEAEEEVAEEAAEDEEAAEAAAEAVVEEILGTAEVAEEAAEEAAEEVAEEAEEVVEVAAEEAEEIAEAAAEEVAEEVAEEAAEEVEVAEDDPDAVLKAFLAGKKLNERVVSADGTFVIEAGETITAEVLDAAAAADALLLLTMSVDE